MALNHRRLITLCADEDSAIDFFRQRGLLHQQRYCECGNEMRQSTHNVRGTTIQEWRCLVKQCKLTKGLRPGTWFERSTLRFVTMLEFFYWWSHEQTSIAFCEWELEMNHNTIVDWSMYMREVCANYLLQHQGRIGGRGQIVEIDEAMFS